MGVNDIASTLRWTSRLVALSPFIQARSIWFSETAVAVKPVGAVGGAGTVVVAVSVLE
jgi:hypothetical protein